MSEIKNELDRIANAVESSHQKVAEMGGTTAQPYKAENLPKAIGTIPNFTDAAPAIHAEQHRSSDTITWDGDTTGMTVADFPIENFTFVHVSDATPSVADVVDRAVFAQYMDSDGEQTEEEMLVDNNMIDQSDGCFLIQVTILVAPHDNAMVEVSAGGGELANAFFPKKGIYFALFDDGETHMHIAKLTIPGHNLIGGTDPISPGMISAAPENHSSPEPKYGVADEERYGHARAYAQPYFADEEGVDMIDPNGNEFTFGVPSGYFLDMGFFFAFYGLVGVSFEDYDAQLVAINALLQEHKTKIAQLEKDIAALKG